MKVIETVINKLHTRLYYSDIRKPMAYRNILANETMTETGFISHRLGYIFRVSGSSRQAYMDVKLTSRRILQEKF